MIGLTSRAGGDPGLTEIDGSLSFSLILFSVTSVSHRWIAPRPDTLLCHLGQPPLEIEQRGPSSIKVGDEGGGIFDSPNPTKEAIDGLACIEDIGEILNGLLEMALLGLSPLERLHLAF
jgi:hypothetical protein